VLAAVGVDAAGATKHVLGLCARVRPKRCGVRALLADLVERGIAAGRSLLIVIDGAKALHKAWRRCSVRHALIQRCREHKNAMVTDALPERLRGSIRRRDESGLRDARPQKRAPASARGSRRSSLNISIRAPLPRCARDWRKR